MIDKIKAATIAALAALAIILYFQGQGLRRDLRDLENLAEGLKAENATMKSEAAENLATLAERENKLMLLRRETENGHKALEEVYEKDEKARAWADAVCPDGLWECFMR